MKLLSIGMPNHDASLSYYDGYEVKYTKLERIKQIKRYPFENLWDWIYETENIFKIDIQDLDAVVVSMDISRCYDEMPIELREIQLEGKYNYINLKDIPNPFSNYYNKDIYFLSHHYAHSLSTWMLEEKEPDVAIVIDGLGDHRTWSVYRKDLLIDKGDLKNGSIGWAMEEAGKFLGVTGKRNDLAGKVMGLQSYGNLDNGYLDYLRQYDIMNINDIFSLDHWGNYKGDKLVARMVPLDWIRTVHHRIGEVLIEFFDKYAKRDEIISYSGGVAQNVIWNTELRKAFKNIIIPPHSADEGLSLGGLEWLRKRFDLEKLTLKNFPYSQYDMPPKTEVTSHTINLAAKLLSEGKIVGWYQGNGEVGPRALGNRSILFDPRIVNGKAIVNTIKKRENYRPFGASILKEFANEYFDIEDDPYMLYTAKIKSNFYPAITHVDQTCRVQTVDSNNKIFRKLLNEFYILTGCPILLNTSLNLAGQPLAGYPEIAKDLFSMTDIDAVFVGNEYFIK